LVSTLYIALTVILIASPCKAAVALPATILKVADVIDNPWQMAVDRSRKAGAGKIANPLFFWE
jgi:hypothetical protein